MPWCRPGPRRRTADLDWGAQYCFEARTAFEFACVGRRRYWAGAAQSNDAVNRRAIWATGASTATGAELRPMPSGACQIRLCPHGSRAA
jgi:hypothetical protein